MKKVLIVSTVGLIYDGITSVIVSYLQVLNKRGLDIYVAATISVEPEIRKQIEDCGCKIVEFPDRRSNTFEYFIALTRFIRRNHIDLIHAHGNSATLVIELVAALLGGCKERLAHSHNTKCNQEKMDKFLRPLFYLLYTKGVACGVDAGKWLFRNRTFEILNNGRNIETYKFDEKRRADVREKLGFKNDLVIGNVAGFFGQKNHEFLIEVLKELKKIEPNCKMVLIGDGPLKVDIENKCKDLDVIFTGAINNVPDYLNAMDGMLLPSLFEGLPLVAIEWQINGLPCILSNNVTDECNLTGKVKYLSLEDNPAIWAEILVDMIHKNSRAEASEDACSRLRYSVYDIERSTIKLRNLYLE